MILLVTYDLKSDRKDYQALYEKLKSASNWWHYLGSTWLLYTTEDVGTWVDRIREVVKEGDHFIVIDITKQKRNGWLPKKAWEWIRRFEQM